MNFLYDIVQKFGGDLERKRLNSSWTPPSRPGRLNGGDSHVFCLCYHMRQLSHLTMSLPHTFEQRAHGKRIFLRRCMECRRGLAMRILSVCLSVCPFVCLSVKRVNCEKTEEKSVQIFIPHEISFSQVF